MLMAGKYFDWCCRLTLVAEERDADCCLINMLCSDFLQLQVSCWSKTLQLYTSSLLSSSQSTCNLWPGRHCKPGEFPYLGPILRRYFRHPTLTFTPKSDSVNTDIQNCQPDTLNTPLQPDTYIFNFNLTWDISKKIWGDTRHSDPTLRPLYLFTPHLKNGCILDGESEQNQQKGWTF